MQLLDEHFLREHWERRPRVFEQPFPEPFLTAGGVLEALRAAGATASAPHGRAALRAWVGDDVRDDADRMLPRADASADVYLGRLEREIGAPFAVVLNDAQAFSEDMWIRLGELLLPLYTRVGMPAHRVEADVFAGNYPATPFGVHKDNASVFCFIVHGNKRIRLWPGPALDGRIPPFGTRDYARYLDSSAVLEGGPGDVLYWPSSYWHVGEAGDAPSISVSVGLHLHTETHRVVGRIVQELLRRHGGALSEADVFPFDAGDLARTARAVPLTLLGPVDVLRGSIDDVEAIVAREWADRVTGFGFSAVPALLEPERLSDDDLIERDARIPVVVQPIGDRVLCSAGGHSFTVQAPAPIDELLHRLEERGRQPTRVLLAPWDHETPGLKERMRAALTELVRRRVVKRPPGA